MRSHADAVPLHAATALWRRARRILCVRLDALGDVLMTTPALRALKHSAPAREIFLLTSPAGAAVAPHVPEIDRVLVWEAPWIKHPQAPTPAATDAFVERLRSERYDAAVIFTVYSQSALPAAMLCWLADIPLRLAHTRENPYHLLSDWEPEREPAALLRHEVRRQLDLVASIGARTNDERLSFKLYEKDDARALRALRKAGVRSTRDWIVVHPGASAASRRYPLEHYAAALRLLAQADDRPILVTGGAQERDLVHALAAEVPGAVPLAGALRLGELGCVISRAALLIANNTGPAHIAAALGTPIVDLYALTNPQHTPWQVPHRVLSHDVPCRNCYRSVCPERHHLCLRGVPPEAVVRAALELLQEREPHASPPTLHAHTERATEDALCIR
ncbi:MAG TPA: glycosyltransferase family 9 protein [Burkholderiales bacterium]|nr:glycosyltransferase family 9 protein [Burkholderiales bacterium]